MKIHREQPITIVLETEQEAAAFFAMANYAPISEWLDTQGVNAETIRRATTNDIAPVSFNSLRSAIRVYVKASD